MEADDKKPFPVHSKDARQRAYELLATMSISEVERFVFEMGERMRPRSRLENDSGEV